MGVYIDEIRARNVPEVDVFPLYPATIALVRRGRGVQVPCMSEGLLPPG